MTDASVVTKRRLSIVGLPGWCTRPSILRPRGAARKRARRPVRRLLRAELPGPQARELERGALDPGVLERDLAFAPGDAFVLGRVRGLPGRQYASSAAAISVTAPWLRPWRSSALRVFTSSMQAIVGSLAAAASVGQIMAVQVAARRCAGAGTDDRRSKAGLGGAHASTES
ncbi:MAG: hypothetical protein IPG91_07830 [Ideonella sp.]|nr:hypothetical protein [Ideonella sp.]